MEITCPAQQGVPTGTTIFSDGVSLTAYRPHGAQWRPIGSVTNCYSSGNDMAGTTQYYCDVMVFMDEDGTPYNPLPERAPILCPGPSPSQPGQRPGRPARRGSGIAERIVEAISEPSGPSDGPVLDPRVARLDGLRSRLERLFLEEGSLIGPIQSAYGTELPGDVPRPEEEKDEPSRWDMMKYEKERKDAGRDGDGQRDA